MEPDPDRDGWIRMVNVDGTDRTFRWVNYDSEPLDIYWQYHQLDCGCKTVTFPDLKEIPKIGRRKNESRGNQNFVCPYKRQIYTVLLSIKSIFHYDGDAFLYTASKCRMNLLTNRLIRYAINAF